MMNTYNFSSLGSGRLIKVCFLGIFIVSCSPGPYTPTQYGNQVPPPPPFVPYELHPGDAAKVRRATNNIRAAQHSAAPRFLPSAFPSPYPITKGYPAVLTITNNTDCKLGVYLDGPSPRQLGVDPQQSETINIAEGPYGIGIDTRLCAGNISPLYIDDVFTAGRLYTMSLSPSRH